MAGQCVPCSSRPIIVGRLFQQQVNYTHCCGPTILELVNLSQLFPTMRQFLELWVNLSREWSTCPKGWSTCSTFVNFSDSGSILPNRMVNPYIDQIISQFNLSNFVSTFLTLPEYGRRPIQSLVDHSGRPVPPMVDQQLASGSPGATGCPHRICSAVDRLQ